ncbi:MAG TPA: LuxR C-terminal-related transcriptional regulator [Bryobacteraceae bacterium]|jgi:DNA-binding CsgD family transcriptional regulator
MSSEMSPKDSFSDLSGRALSVIAGGRLTPREMRLLICVANGYKNADIARHLQISEGTVKVYSARLCQKLGVENRFQLAMVGLRLDHLSQAYVPEDVIPERQHADIKTANRFVPTPPINAQLLMDLFLQESRCEEFLGDLEERYSRKLMRLGKTRSDIWYCKQVLTSLWPLFAASSVRVSKGSVSHVFCFVLRLLGLGGWADALRKAAEDDKKRSI